MNTHTKDNFSMASAHDRPTNLLFLSVYYHSVMCYVVGHRGWRALQIPLFKLFTTTHDMACATAPLLLPIT